jgi:hypothetical protein
MLLVDIPMGRDNFGGLGLGERAVDLKKESVRARDRLCGLVVRVSGC